MRRIFDDTRLFKADSTSNTMAITTILKVSMMSTEREKRVGMYDATIQRITSCEE